MEWREYALRMAFLARDLPAQDSVQATLDEIAASAVKLVEGCDAAGILAVRKGRAVTVAAYGDSVHECDRLQGELGEGPCFDLARRKDGERIYRMEDLTQPQPAWERFAAAARTLGIGSMTGLLLYTDKADFGALNLYARRSGAFGKGIETAGWLLASNAAVAWPTPARSTSSSTPWKPGTPSARPWASSWNATTSARTTPSTCCAASPSTTTFMPEAGKQGRRAIDSLLGERAEESSGRNSPDAPQARS
jgi:hypothetical protein